MKFRSNVLKSEKNRNDLGIVAELWKEAPKNFLKNN